MPNAWPRYLRATSPSATRAAVSRALARSSTGRASSCPYFCMPVRSAWPGRGLVSGAFLAWSASSAALTGSGDITVSHLGHSVLAIRTATGPPSVTPCRTPPVISAASCSNFIRAPRPYPPRLLASADAMSAVVTSTPAGTPSQIATSARPCDSPAVSQRSIRAILPCSGLRPAGRGCHRDRDATAQPVTEAGHDVGSEPAGRFLACHRGTAVGERHVDLQVASVGGSGEAQPGDRRLPGPCGLHRGQHVRILVRRRNRPPVGERGEPRSVDRHRDRPGHVHDDRARVLGRRPPHLGGERGNRPCLPPPHAQRLAGGKCRYRPPSVAPDQRGQRHLGPGVTSVGPGVAGALRLAVGLGVAGALRLAVGLGVAGALRLAVGLGVAGALRLALA